MGSVPDLHPLSPSAQPAVFALNQIPGAAIRASSIRLHVISKIGKKNDSAAIPLTRRTEGKSPFGNSFQKRHSLKSPALCRRFGVESGLKSGLAGGSFRQWATSAGLA